MNLTTNPLRPAMTSPTKVSSQNTDASQDSSCMSKNMTKWRISAHEGSRKPHELWRGRGEGIGGERENGEERRLRSKEGERKRKEQEKEMERRQKGGR